MFSLDDTIAAIASAPGGAARGIVRLSGPRAVEIVSSCFRPRDTQATLKEIKAPTAVDGEVRGIAHSAPSPPTVNLPATLFLWPTARSYTRQPMAELHTIGSPPLVDWLLQTICGAGARLAQPGEFTLRAFLAGRIDLTQAEAVLGVVDAGDRKQLDTALAQLAGGLSKPLQIVREDLLNLLADLEAGLDFAEEDIRFVERDELDVRLANAADQLESLVRQLGERADANQLPRVVLIGPPNAGKSSLFNALVRNQSALVSPLAGTTRDYLSARIHCGELEVELIDTAGIDTKSQPLGIDQAAQEAAVGQHRQADLRVLCVDVERMPGAGELFQVAGENTLVALTKVDVLSEGASDQLFASYQGSLRPPIATSSHAGEGLDELQTAIAAALSSRPGDSHAVAGTAVRARESVRLAADALAHARQLAVDGAGEELVAAQLRAALEELGKVIGAIYTDDLLDRIFSRFCIGK